ncbi:MAG: AraC family transcriptional regulator, partial [Spirochaetota bacterium]
PFRGALQKMYAEGKALELTALALSIVQDESQQWYRSLSHRDENRMREVAYLLDVRMRTPPSLSEVAKVLGISVAKLKRDFKRTHGLNVHEYLVSKRLEAARTLIMEKDLSVKEAAYIVGYRSQSYFSIAFRQKFGENPGELCR